VKPQFGGARVDPRHQRPGDARSPVGRPDVEPLDLSRALAAVREPGTPRRRAAGVGEQQRTRVTVDSREILALGPQHAGKLVDPRWRRPPGRLRHGGRHVLENQGPRIP